jgi:hypothetical protein
MRVDLEIGDRVRIKRGQPWAECYGTYIGVEDTLVGMMYKIKLDNGFSVLQTRGYFITHPVEVNHV